MLDRRRLRRARNGRRESGRRRRCSRPRAAAPARLRCGLRPRSRWSRRSSRPPTPAGSRALRPALRAPHFTRQVRPRASRTDTQGCEPSRCSSRNVNGGSGAPSWPPGPAARSSCVDVAGIAPDHGLRRSGAARSRRAPDLEGSSGRARTRRHATVAGNDADRRPRCDRAQRSSITVDELSRLQEPALRNASAAGGPRLRLEPSVTAPVAARLEAVDTGLVLVSRSLLLLSRRIRRRCASKARWRRPTRALPNTSASLVGAPVEPGDPTRCCATATRSFRRCSTRFARRSAASASRASSTRTARSAISSPASWSPPPGAASRCASCSTRSAARSRRASQKKLTDAGVSVGVVQPAAAVDARGGQLPHAPQGARRRRRGRRSPAASGSPITGSDTRRVPSTGATRSSRYGPRGARARGVVLRELARIGRRSVPALDPEQPPQGTGARSVVVWSNPTGGASNVKLLYLLSIAGAREQIDIQSPVLHPRRIHAVVARAARKRGVQRPHPDRRRDHRREAGEGREPRRLSGAARCRLRDLRVPADDDARQGDDGRRRVERHRLGELRQSIVRAERRADGGRRRS